MSLHIPNWKDLYKTLSFYTDVWYLLKVIIWQRFGLKTEAPTLSKVTLSFVVITLGFVNTIWWMDNTGISSTILQRTKNSRWHRIKATFNFLTSNLTLHGDMLCVPHSSRKHILLGWWERTQALPSTAGLYHWWFCLVFL